MGTRLEEWMALCDEPKHGRKENNSEGCTDAFYFRLEYVDNRGNRPQNAWVSLDKLGLSNVIFSFFWKLCSFLWQKWNH